MEMQKKIFVNSVGMMEDIQEFQGVGDFKHGFPFDIISASAVMVTTQLLAINSNNIHDNNLFI